MSTKDRKRRSAVCGICFMIAYLYLYEITWVALHGLGLGATNELFYVRRLPAVVDMALTFLAQVLWVFSFPIAQLVYRLDLSEAYYVNLVYLPFAAALQWFGWGYFIGWIFLQKGRSQKVHTEPEENRK
jgi:hypothetical protein